MTFQPKEPKLNKLNFQIKQQKLINLDNTSINSSLTKNTKVEFDLTFQKEKSLKSLSQEAKQFQDLIEKTTALIYVIQGKKICYTNQRLESNPNFSLSQLISNSNFYHQLSQFQDEPKKKEKNTEEILIKVEQNKNIWLSCSWETIEWNRKLAIIITIFDITKYKNKEIKLSQDLKTEKENLQNKSHFVSIVSHEFRTPLNIISFSTSLLKRHLNQWTKEKQLEYLTRLQNAIEQLTNLMDEVLILGRAEAGKLKLDPQPLNLNSFCERILTEINSSQPHVFNINFTNLVKYETILLDKNLLKLILSNLLSNAIKYSPSDQKTVKFVVSCEAKLLTFKITDRGIGIPLEEQSKIFEPFYRSKNVGELPGHGLGLAISKKLVELQGGTITLESEVEIGSTFTIKIPFKIC